MEFITIVKCQISYGNWHPYGIHMESSAMIYLVLATVLLLPASSYYIHCPA